MASIYKILALMLLCLNISYANQELFNEVKNNIAKMESNNRYDIVNKNGFLGKYQFGAMGLVDLGLLSKERYKANTYTVQTETRKAKVMWRDGLSLNAFMNNPSNWNINGGKEAFLSTPRVQEEAMDKALMRNYRALSNRGFDMNNRTLAKSLLMASHFGGITSAVNYANSGTEYKDAFGTKISKYYGATSEAKQTGTKKVVFKFEN